MTARNTFVVAAALIAAPAAAHHGIGTFNTREEITIAGTVTGVDFINPHSWLYLDVTGGDGKTAAWRCEMRSATTLRRSGWSPEMFKRGEPVTIMGSPDRNDPNSCYLATIVFADGRSADRYGQLSTAPAPRVAADRPARLPSGEPNLSGDWAPEQIVMTDPRGRGGALVPLSQAQTFEPGANTQENARQYRTRDVELTPAGQEKADAFETYNPLHSPRMRCETTSIIFDWTYDGAVNRVTQNGRHGDTRVRPVRLHAHDSPEPCRASGEPRGVTRRSLDRALGERRARRRTVGFAAGVLSPPVLHTEQLHVVERFSLDAAGPTLRRSYTAEDPAHWVGTYSGDDMLAVADVAYSPDECKAELTFIDYSKEGQRGARNTGAAKPWWKFWD